MSRAANVAAAEDLTVYLLGRKEFFELLGPLHTLLEHDLTLEVTNSFLLCCRQLCFCYLWHPRQGACSCCGPP